MIWNVKYSQDQLFIHVFPPHTSRQQQHPATRFGNETRAGGDQGSHVVSTPQWPFLIISVPTCIKHPIFWRGFVSLRRGKVDIQPTSRDLRSLDGFLDETFAGKQTIPIEWQCQWGWHIFGFWGTKCLAFKSASYFPDHFPLKEFWDSSYKGFQQLSSHKHS